MTALRVALVDDHALVVHTVRAALDDAGIECAAIPPAAAPELYDAILAAEPSLVLLDLNLGDFGSAIPLITPLTMADLRVLVFTGETNRILLAEALEAGAVRIVRKDLPFPEFVRTIRRIAESTGVPRDPQAGALLTELAEHRRGEMAAKAVFEELTFRERETLAELAHGQSVHDIAARWVVSVTTVRSHVRSILTKLGVQSQLQAVVMAVQHGWIRPADTNRDADHR